MRTSFFSFLLISCLFFSLSNLSHASQADQLRRLMKAKRSSTALHYNSWTSTDASEVYKPVYMSPQVGLMDADKITALPGQQDNVDFNQYAGYVTVDAKAGRALFYYFVESPQDPSTKPLVLWLNGGPGCSSLGYGAMEELGPFRVNRDGKTLYQNNYAWNNVANVIFLESPAGVGFSYSNTSSDIDRSGDNTTTIDSYTFLVNWLERFPQYKTRDFFITGESYAGHYIPELAYTIIQSNQITNQTIINLRGVAMGNADIGAVENGLTGYDYFWTHALISDETYYLIHNLCNFSAPISDECEIALDKADNESGNIDIYNIYAPLCHGLNSSSSSGVSMADFDPCSDNYVYSYLNLPSVQRALHANVTALPYDWEACRNLDWKDAPATVVPLIEHVIAGGISVWLYSGDIDGVIPVTYTRKILSVLELPIEKPWRPWYSSGEVGGYVVEYKGLTFVTVRGAGHTVPSYQPERALTMISSFLQGKAPQ